MGTTNKEQGSGIKEGAGEMIEGKLVRLRALEPTDAERAFQFINDREVTQFLMARYPWSLAAERDFVTESAKRIEFGDVRLAIETKEDRVHIGMCGLHRARPEDRNAELGIMIGDKSYWNGGYGTDAMMTLLRLGFEQMNLHKVALGVFDFNERAQAVYRRCGFVEEGRFREEVFQDGRYVDVVRMSVLRREFEALRGAASVATRAERT
jgi:RimJ/RimL family protein N-acetyltransferase